jgi:hypothetical protein
MTAMNGCRLGGIEKGIPWLLGIDVGASFGSCSTSLRLTRGYFSRCSFVELLRVTEHQAPSTKQHPVMMPCLEGDS